MNNDLIAWYPWSEATFALARNEERAIFLSVGRQSCYWCNRMTEESFSDEVIATLLKENFIAVQVDGDLHPDIGHYFHAVFTQMTGRVATYPLSIFITPEKIPFYAASYIPDRRRDGMMGFDETLELVAQKYDQERNTLISKGNEILKVMGESDSNIKATQLNDSILPLARQQILQLFDAEHGGFGDKPKFPHHSVLSLALDLLEKQDDKQLLEVVHSTLDAMIISPLYDSEAGGFHHYCSDRAWQNPQQGKTLYNSTQMVEILVRAYRLENDERYKQVAIKTASFMERVMCESDAITSWQAMSIKALLILGELESSYLQRAKKMLDELMVDRSKIRAVLEDYAYVSDTLLKAYDITKKETYLIRASELINEAIRQFFAGGKWRYVNGDLMTYAGTEDGDYPSSLSVMTRVLQKVTKLINPEYEKFYKRTLEVYSYDLMRQPISMPELARVAVKDLIESQSRRCL